MPRGDPQDERPSFRIRPDELAQIDQAAAHLGKSRSQFLREAAIGRAAAIILTAGEATRLEAERDA